MKSLLAIMLVGVLGTAVCADRADAAQRGGHRGHPGKAKARVSKVHHDDRYFRGRDVVVIRDYYRPYYRPVPPGLRARYIRGGHLPQGWARRVRPVPRRYDREFVAVPRGYHRGVIDGYAVVYNDRGLILDLAFLF